MTWNSYHLFYYDVGRHDRLIATGLGGFIDDLRQRGFAGNFFFIRYYELGPHIRIRLQVRNSAEAHWLNTAADQYWSGYLSTHPSAELEVPEDPRLPNNTLHAIPYEPETERYGGPVGLKLAEEHFNTSSTLALRLISASEIEGGTAAEKKLKMMTYAVQLCAMTAHAAGFNREDFPEFFADYLRHLRISSPLDVKLEQFPAMLREQLRDSFKKLGARPYEGQSAHPTVTSDWIRSVSRTSASVKEALQQEPRFAAMSTCLSCPQKYATIIQAYVHMLLNRLGFWGRSEHLVIRLCEEIARNAMSGLGEATPIPHE